MRKPDFKLNEKRADLQGLRGLAILSVISFHFFPSHFPNGYLGVDQFFLLSGYLMQMLLSREQSGPFSLITNFYSRRFRRILPLYLFFITLSLITLYQCFPEAAIDINLKSASKALIFVSNTPKTAADDYFQMVSSATDIFTHTWSLSVEIQFYLIAPFLFILSARFERQGQKMFYAVIGMIINVLSTKFETDKAPSTDEEEQCLLIRDPEHDPQPYTQVCKTIAVLSVISITGSSTLLEESLARNLITLSTSLIILIPYQDVFLSSRPLAYLGDVSYSLYLVHWPIYAYWKLNGDSKNLFIYLLSAIILAIILHETFEKWYLQLSSTSVGALVAFLFLINVLVINNSVIRQLIRNGSDKELDRAARLNSYWNKYDNELLSVPSCEYEAPETKPVGWCRHKGLSPTAPYKMAIIGNSWAANHGKLFYEECGYKARSILQGAAYACEPLYPTRDKPGCKENFTDFEERIRKEKPDYAFILTRFLTIGEPDSDDSIYQTMLQQTRKLISHVKIKFFILNAIPRLHSDKVDKIVPMLQDGLAPVDIDKVLIDMEGYQIARRRYQWLIRDCDGKLELIDYQEAFFNSTSQSFRYFDKTGLSFFTSTIHLSPHGIDHVRSVWKGLCEGL